MNEHLTKVRLDHRDKTADSPGQCGDSTLKLYVTGERQAVLRIAKAIRKALSEVKA